MITLVSAFAFLLPYVGEPPEIEFTPEQQTQIAQGDLVYLSDNSTDEVMGSTIAFRVNASPTDIWSVLSDWSYEIGFWRVKQVVGDPAQSDVVRHGKLRLSSLCANGIFGIGSFRTRDMAETIHRNLRVVVAGRLYTKFDPEPLSPLMIGGLLGGSMMVIMAVICSRSPSRVMPVVYPGRGQFNTGCPMCFMVSDEQLGHLSCGHTYHLGCIQEWLKKTKGVICPHCGT